MGGWRMEAFRMSVYMSFPVLTFWWFNQPQFYEKWMMKNRETLFPSNNPKTVKALRDAIENVERNKQLKLDRELAALEE